MVEAGLLLRRIKFDENRKVIPIFTPVYNFHVGDTTHMCTHGRRKNSNKSSSPIGITKT